MSGEGKHNVHLINEFISHSGHVFRVTQQWVLQHLNLLESEM